MGGVSVIHLGGVCFGDLPVGGFGREPPVGGCILEGLCVGPTCRWMGINVGLVYVWCTPNVHLMCPPPPEFERWLGGSHL